MKVADPREGVATHTLYIVYTRNTHAQWTSGPAQLCVCMSINNIPDRDEHVHVRKYHENRSLIQSLRLMHSAITSGAALVHRLCEFQCRTMGRMCRSHNFFVNFTNDVHAVRRRLKHHHMLVAPYLVKMQTFHSHYNYVLTLFAMCKAVRILHL